MATVKQYTTRLRSAHERIALKLGTDMVSAPKELRVAVTGGLVLLAVVVKTLVDKGVVTDAELNATFTAVEEALYDDEPANP